MKELCGFKFANRAEERKGAEKRKTKFEDINWKMGKYHLGMLIECGL